MARGSSLSLPGSLEKRQTPALKIACLCDLGYFLDRDFHPKRLTHANARKSALIGEGPRSYPVAIVCYTPIVAVAVCWHSSLAAIMREHQDPKTTGKYAHVVDRAQNNPAAAVPVN